MKRFFCELSIILLLGIGSGVIYNHFQKPPLPLFCDYNPKTDPVFVSADPAASISFNEMDVETLRSLLETDMIVLLDARHPEKYKEGHLPKAISLPIGEFNQKYTGVEPFLAKNKSIVIYCIGIDCRDSEDLARELYKKGYRELFLYKGGFDEWQNFGYPVETAENQSQ